MRSRVRFNPTDIPKESQAMIPTRSYLFILVLSIAGGVMTAADLSAESHQAFRQANGLQVYLPPENFLQGSFIASEKEPAYIFGSVQEFAAALDGTTTWLIEDLELERLKAATAAGRQIEY